MFEALIDFRPPVPDAISPLLVVAVIVIVGGLGGRLAKSLGVPSVTGNIFAGLLIGPAALDLFQGVYLPEMLGTLSTVAMGLITVNVGRSLDYDRIHNALRRILVISFCEVLCTLLLVFSLCRMAGAPREMALLLCILAVETAPATTIMLIRENRAKGTFVKTLLSVTALNNIACIVLFAFASPLLADYFEAGGEIAGVARPLLQVLYQFAGAVVIGLGTGRLISYLDARPALNNWSDFSLMLGGVLLCCGAGSQLGVSPLLTCLFLGITLGNSGRRGERLVEAIRPVEQLVFISFFTIAGASLHLAELFSAGWIFVAFVASRILGKGFGSMAGGILSQSTPRIWSNFPFALVPQAGITVGLVVLLESNPDIPREMAASIGAAALAAVTLNEIIGPFGTRFALRRAKEAGLDRPRLISFLQEEYILTDLEAKDKWEAIDKLAQFFNRTHRVPRAQQVEVRESITAREKEFSTAVGEGVAIPHGRIANGEAVQGVLGISRKGIAWDSPDEEPVRVIALIVTPEEHEKRHLEVMAALASMLGDEVVRTMLFNAADPNEAWEIIESEETPNFNYFLEDGESDR